jgi:hypothetical protein
LLDNSPFLKAVRVYKAPNTIAAIEYEHIQASPQIEGRFTAVYCPSGYSSLLTDGSYSKRKKKGNESIGFDVFSAKLRVWPIEHF